jgi:anti-anti-sigma regulatory factor
MGSVSTPAWSPMSSSATLRALHKCREDTWVLELSGEADITTLDLLRGALGQLATIHGQDVVVDVGKLGFCDVASAHLILTARRMMPITLSGATGSVERVFALMEALQRQRLPRYLPVATPRWARVQTSVSA